MNPSNQQLFTGITIGGALFGGALTAGGAYLLLRKKHAHPLVGSLLLLWGVPSLLSSIALGVAAPAFAAQTQVTQ